MHNARDHNRVTADFGGSVTVYVGAYYEKTTSGSSTTITKYYQAGGQRIALRVNGVVRWLATDHPSTVLRTGLGSTSVTASENGTPDAELRYKPWGESRGIPFGATPTQRRFTGQVLDEVAGGLYFYNARYYDPALGRFAQADTIVPDPQNPQNLNRYSYAANNPIVYIDASGFSPQYPGDPDQNNAACSTDWCWQNRWHMAHGFAWNVATGLWDIGTSAHFYDRNILDDLLTETGMQAVGQWTFDQLSLVGQAVVDLYKRIGSTERLDVLLGPNTVRLVRQQNGLFGCKDKAGCAWVSTIWIYDGAFKFGSSFAKGTIVHELAHIIDAQNIVWYHKDWLGSQGAGPSRVFPVEKLITTYSASNDQEYWAEALADWVYGGSYKGPYNPDRNSLSVNQADWINRFLKGWGW